MFLFLFRRRRRKSQRGISRCSICWRCGRLTAR